MMPPLSSTLISRPLAGRRNALAAGVLSTIALAALATPAAAQIDDATYAAAEQAVAAYADDMNRAAPCIYISSIAFNREGVDVFDEVWGETAVADAIEEIDGIGENQFEALVDVFRDIFAVDYAVDDIREIAQFCYVSGDDDTPIFMQLQMFRGVGIPFEIRLERALD